MDRNESRPGRDESRPDRDERRPVRDERRRDLLGKLALVLFSAALTFVAVEIALRLTERQKTKMFRFNPRTIYELTPNTERTFSHAKGNGGHSVETRINTDGFRGEELQPNPERRVVVFGDSFIQGEFSARENTFVGRLATEFNRSCPGTTEVINAGVIGYGPDQVLRRLETELPRLKPDLVIVAIFADNDFGDLLRNKIFALSPEGELVENPVRLSRSLERSLGIRRDLAWVKLARKAYWHWLTWREVRPAPSDDEADEKPTGDRSDNEPSPGIPPRKSDTQVIDKWLASALDDYERYVVRGDSTIRRIDYDHYDADISLLPDSESAGYKLRLMALILKEIQAVLAQASVDHLLTIIPSPIDVCEGYDFEVDPAKYPQYNERALTSAVEQSAAAAGLPYLSFWNTFAENDPNSLYFHYGDDHWNDRGQELAASTVIRWLTENTWPECRAELDD